MGMDNPTASQKHPEEEDGFRQVLMEIHVAALRGLAQANDELARADEGEDWEGWSLWRGYRRAMLEVLALTEKAPLPQVVSPPAGPPSQPPTQPFTGSQGDQEAKPA
jgi:hypothetical protein